MVETDIYKYSLNSDGRNQSLKISLINNSHVALILTNKDTQKNYGAAFNLLQLKDMSQGFASLNTAKDALLVIKDLIESGRLEITEETSSNILKYVLTLEIGNYPPFDIDLLLDENNNSIQENNNANTVQNEANTSQNTPNTAQNAANTQSEENTIIQSNVNKAPMQFEYIEPILQLHYPDGRTENKPLPPVIKGVGGENQNISEEQMKLIKEQINRDNAFRQLSPVKNNSNFLNSNSEQKEESSFNRANSSSINNNVTQVNKLKNIVRPLNQNSANRPISRVKSAFNLNNMDNNIRYNTMSNYNNNLDPQNPFAQTQNPNLQNNNFNNTYNFHNLKLNHNQMIEKRPRLINQRDNEVNQNLLNRFNQQNSGEINHAKTQMVSQAKNVQPLQNQFKKPSQIVPLDNNQESGIEALFMTEEGKIIFRNGLLRGIIHKYAEIDEVVSRIQDILCKGVMFHLAYKAFDLDDRAQTFHEKCDALNMSLVLIETDKDKRFGGFTTKSWQGNCIRRKDKFAFVFSLDNNKIYPIIEGQLSTGCYPKYGPVFFGCQIRIYDEFFTKGGTTCHKGLNYATTIDYELSGGEQNFLVKDIEVYGIETININ